jgi:hypothetical protein
MKNKRRTRYYRTHFWKKPNLIQELSKDLFDNAEALSLFIEACHGSRFSFYRRNRFEIDGLDFLIKAQLIGFRRFFNLNTKRSEFGISLRNPLGVRICEMIFDAQPEELSSPISTISHQDLVEKATSELGGKWDYEVKIGNAKFDAVNEDTVLEAECGTNLSGQVVKHIQDARENKPNLIISSPPPLNLFHINYLTSLVLRAHFKRTPRNGKITIALGSIPIRVFHLNSIKKIRLETLDFNQHVTGMPKDFHKANLKQFLSGNRHSNIWKDAYIENSPEGWSGDLIIKLNCQAI